MLSITAAQVVLLVYALLLAAGGVMGYVKAGSRPSLIAGVGSAVLSLIALAISFRSPFYGLVIAAIIASILCVFFNYRYVLSKTRKFMPSGLLALISLLVSGYLIVIVVWANGRVS